MNYYDYLYEDLYEVLGRPLSFLIDQTFEYKEIRFKLKNLIVKAKTLKPDQKSKLRNFTIKSSDKVKGIEYFISICTV